MADGTVHGSGILSLFLNIRADEYELCYRLISWSFSSCFERVATWLSVFGSEVCKCVF